LTPFTWLARFAFVAGVELLRDEITVTPEDDIGRDHGGEFAQSLAANGVSLDGQEPTLVRRRKSASFVRD